MEHPDVVFVLEPEQDGSSCLARLARRFRTGIATHATEQRTYYDTLDARLLSQGARFRATRRGSGVQLAFTSPNGRAGRRARAREVPAFARELPPGPLRDELMPWVHPRRLHPLVELRLQRVSQAILDERDKTVARVELLLGSARRPGSRGDGAALAARLSVGRVRGYDEEHAQVVRFVEREPGVRRSEDADPLADALRVAGIEPARAPRAPPLRPELRADEAFQAVLTGLLAVVRANWEGARRDLDPEHLHELRVAVRRARAALAQLGSVLPPRVAEHWRGELAWLGEITGPVRDLDVLLLWIDEERGGPGDAAGRDLEPLLEHLRRRKAQEHERLLASLDGPRAQELLSAWDDLVRRTPPARPLQHDAWRPVGEVAAEGLGRAARRLTKRVRRAARDGDARALHALRLSAKRLRYLLDVFAGLLPEEEGASVLEFLRRLQTLLGRVQDAAVHERLLGGVVDELVLAQAVPPGLLLAVGRLQERLARTGRKAERRARKRLADLTNGREALGLRRLAEGLAEGGRSS